MEPDDPEERPQPGAFFEDADGGGAGNARVRDRSRLWRVALFAAVIGLGFLIGALAARMSGASSSGAADDAYAVPVVTPSISTEFVTPQPSPRVVAIATPSQTATPLATPTVMPTETPSPRAVSTPRRARIVAQASPGVAQPVPTPRATPSTVTPPASPSPSAQPASSAAPNGYAQSLYASWAARLGAAGLTATQDAQLRGIVSAYAQSHSWGSLRVPENQAQLRRQIWALLTPQQQALFNAQYFYADSSP